MEERSGLHGITLLIDTHTQVYTRTSALIRKMAKEVKTRAQSGVNQRKVAQEVANMALRTVAGHLVLGRSTS